MKKIIILISVFCISCNITLLGQCVIEPFKTCPKTNDIPCVERGVFYQQTLSVFNTVAFFNDTFFNNSPTQFFESFVVDTVFNLPNGLSCLEASGKTSLGLYDSVNLLLSGITFDTAFIKKIEINARITYKDSSVSPPTTNEFVLPLACFSLRIKNVGDTCINVTEPNCFQSPSKIYFKYARPNVKMGGVFKYFSNLNLGEDTICTCNGAYNEIEYEIFPDLPVKIISENITAKGGRVNVIGYRPTYLSIFFPKRNPLDESFYITLGDSTGTKETKQLYFSLSCYDYQFNYDPWVDFCSSMISGRAFLDLNNTCLYETTDAPYPNFTITLKYSGDSVGNQVISSDSGYYTSFYLHENEPFFLHFSVPQGFLGVCPTADTYLELPYVFNGYQSFDLPINAGSIKYRNLGITAIKSGYWLYGYEAYYRIIYYNNGNETIQPQITLNFDSNLVIDSFITPFISYDPLARIVKWQGKTLTIGQFGEILIRFKLPLPSAGVNRVFNQLLIEPLLNDDDLTNNTIVKEEEIVGSYDPNDKSVFPNGSDNSGRISLEDSILTFTIRFQNTGNGPARNVFILDEIDSDLNLETFLPVASSHPYKISFTDRKLRIEFREIMLPDSNTNFIASQGYFQYSIHKKSNLGIGTTISNTANIYFDFNEPITTNTTQSIYTKLTNLNRANETLKINVFPNPASEKIVVLGNFNSASKISLWNSASIMLMEMETENKKQITFSVKDYPPGVYFLKLENNYQKVIIAK